MTHQFYNRLLLAAFITFIIFVTGFTVVTYRSLQKTTHVTADNKTTLVILKNLEVANNYLLEFEKQYHNYLISGDSALLQNINTLAENCLAAIGGLDNIMLSDPIEKQALNHYKVLAKQKIALGYNCISTRNATDDKKLLASLNSDITNSTMDSIKAIVSQIETTERANLAKYNTQKIQNAKNAFTWVFAFSIIAIICFTGFSIAIKRNVDKRLGAEQMLLKANQELEIRVSERTKELQSTTDMLNKIFDRVSDGFVALDKNWNFTYVNQNAARILNHKVTELLGRNNWELFPEDVKLPFHDAYYKAMEQQQYVHIEAFYPPLGLWLENHIYPSPEGISIYFRDITERKKTETALVESEKKYRMLFYNNPLPMFMLSLPDFNFTDVNEAAIKHYGYSHKEFLQMNARDLRPAGEVDKFDRLIVNSNIKGTNHQGQWIHVKKNGEKRSVEIVSHDIIYGDVQQRLILAIDVTEREKALHDLKINNKELADYKFALDESAIVSITDAEGVITHANDNFCHISKYNREELLGQNHRIINSGHHSKAFIRNMWNTIKAGRLWHGEIKNKAKDGTYYWTYSTIVPFIDSHGQPYQYVSIRHNITERKLAEKKLIQSESILKEAQTIAQVGSWDYDMINNTQQWSDELFNLLGYKQEDTEATLEHFLSRVHPDDVDYVRNTIEQNFINGTTSTIHFRFIRKDGELRYGVSEAKFEFDNHHKPLRSYGIIQDVTDIRKAEEEIRLLNENLEKRIADRTAALTQANQALEAFSYSVSHDLRAPVRAVMGFCKLIKNQYSQGLNDDVNEMLQHIESSSIRMNAIIDDMLVLAKYERMKPGIAPVNMSILTQTVWDDILFNTNHKARLELTNLPVVYGDESMLRQVLVNLISNAVKYSSKKENPIVKAGCVVNGNMATFFVRDNGAGFDMRNYDKLFTAFQRLHGYSEFEGTGVGLVLVKKIIEKHGGTVWAESTVNEGATFYFTLPVVAGKPNAISW